MYLPARPHRVAGTLLESAARCCNIQQELPAQLRRRGGTEYLGAGAAIDVEEESTGEIGRHSEGYVRVAGFRCGGSECREGRLYEGDTHGVYRIGANDGAVSLAVFVD